MLQRREYPSSETRNTVEKLRMVMFLIPLNLGHCLAVTFSLFLALMVSLVVIVAVAILILSWTALAVCWCFMMKGATWFPSWPWPQSAASPGPLGDDETGADNGARQISLLQNHSQNSDDSELNDGELKRLMTFLEESDGGPPWQFMMEFSTANLVYQAWYRDPQIGPTQLRTRTVFRNIGPEIVRDFFWDDEFRPSWDNMLIHFKILEIDPSTGSMIVHWIRKLPLFCGNREYVIARRMWESESMYYCVTKGTSHPSIPRAGRSGPVDLYYSSWSIRAVESSNGDHIKGSEVILFHQEDMNFPKGLVKMAVRAGTWSLVKRLDVGMQAYSKARAGGALPSAYAIMSRTATKVSTPTVAVPCLGSERKQKPRKRSFLKWLVIGGILLTCGISCVTMGERISSRRKKVSSNSNPTTRS